MNELVIGDKVYISSKRAAEITGYAKDYVGQLCREGRVEATLVGRSWYVLETAIRTHRFGTTADSKSVEEVKEPEALKTWESPAYKAEPVVTVPTLERQSINLLEAEPVESEEAEVTPSEETPDTVQDMQAAWKEWFASRQQPVAEAEEVAEEPVVPTEDVEEALEPVEDEWEPVAFTPVAPAPTYEPEPTYDPVPHTPEIEEPVSMKRSYDVVRAPAEPKREYVQSAAVEPKIAMREVLKPQKRSASRAGKGSLAVQAGLLAVAALAILVAIVGSGAVDSYVSRDGAQYSIVRFIGGTTIIDK